MADSEFHALLELLAMLVTDPRTGVLLGLLLVAAVTDYRSFRIPNWLTGGGILFALIYNAAVPPQMHADWTWAFAGMLLAFGLTLPLYLIRAMGAGDVKLMAMVGAFLGMHDTLQAMLFTVVTAGVAALAYAAAHGVVLRMLGNVKAILQGMAWTAAAGARPRAQLTGVQSAGKLAYGISIAFGTAAFVVARQFNLV